MLTTHTTPVTWDVLNHILDGNAIYIKAGSIWGFDPSTEFLPSHPDPVSVDVHGKFVLSDNYCADTFSTEHLPGGWPSRLMRCATSHKT